MDIQIIEHIKETLSVVIQCNKIDDEVMRLKSHIESFDNKLYAQKDGTQFWVNLSEVLYFESVDNHTFLYTQEDVMEINKQGEIYTQALIKYQQQRRNVNGK